jgi:hypothetical protein
MALNQFSPSNLVRCPATDREGFRCALPPSHEGEHKWARCDNVDAEGHRCMLSPKHQGAHWLAWFDRPTAPGETHAMRYSGTRASTNRQADADERVYSAHGWVPVSREFRPAWPWRWPPLAGLLATLASSRGQLTVVYEFGPLRT